MATCESGKNQLPIAVIGAGVAGTMTAHSLLKRGYRVALIDALDGPAELCSRANAGIMAVGHADAWASPAALGSMMRAFAGQNPSVRISRLADPALIPWGISFLRNCTNAAYRRNSARLRRLSLYSRNLLSQTEAELGLPEDTSYVGGLYLFQDQRQFAIRASMIDGKGDADLDVVSRQRLLEIEPSLASMGNRLKGGIYSRVDCAGDCRLFTIRTVEALKASNRFVTHFGCRVVALRERRGRITSVETDKGAVDCSGAVLATGVETRTLTKGLGFTPLIYPVKGYSGTWRIRNKSGVPRRPLVDETELLAVASYGGILRVTAIAEFAGLDRGVGQDRTKILSNYVRRTFGDAVEHDTAVFWAGLRPTTPGGPPYLGQVRGYGNLWINAGHGQLGWTMSFGCGELLAQRIHGQSPDLQDVSERAAWLEAI